MARRIRDLVANRAGEGFVGRANDLTRLLGVLERDAPPVWHVYGIAGIGKSRLLDAFAVAARARGAIVVRVDCRAVEPTARAFLHELGVATGDDRLTVEAVADHLGRLGEQVVLVLDTYEVFRLLDTWLRQTFVPALPSHLRVVLAGREPPAPAWALELGWAGLFRGVPLGPLADDAAVEVLVRGGIPDDEARRINRTTRGHPLALQLAMAAADARPDANLEGAALPQVVEVLARTYLADIDDPGTRTAVEAASVVRRVTRPLLAAMLGSESAPAAFDRLQSLPFVEHGRDGLLLHDAVRASVAASLRATDPGRYRAFRRAAWRHLRAEARAAGPAELWRSTADMLFLIENPAIREGFFPSDGHRYAVEPARPGDARAVQAISQRHDGPTATERLLAWWERVPETFWVVRDPARVVVGFCVVFVADEIEPERLRADPLSRGWMSHLRRDPVVGGQRALFCPRWLGRDDGEAPSPVQGALWLAIKRLYMELRPRLRRVYMAQRDLAPHATAMRQLGFRRLPEADVELDGERYRTLMLDMGPASVDGWLTELVAAELGVEEGGILDVAARELVLDDRRVGLTPLEFGVMQYLTEREGRAVSRVDLLADVWGYDYEGGSNVVDVVVRSLRKKLGERATMIEAVRGTGYRLRVA